MTSTHLALLACATALPIAPANADTFGTGANTFTIDFVTIGNPGNAGTTSFEFGAVSYVYQMGFKEVSQAQINKATASGWPVSNGGAFTGDQPATFIEWRVAAAFVNWLNTSTGHAPAYKISSGSVGLWTSAEAWQLDGENLFRHKDAYYFLPSEDEWFKAAFHKNDGATANYWTYGTGSDTAPTGVLSGTAPGTAVYTTATNNPTAPAEVQSSGGLSAYGTRGQSGNVSEWLETPSNRNTTALSAGRMTRGGDWVSSGTFIGSGTNRVLFNGEGDNRVGFRVAAIPEPTSALLLTAAGGTLLLRRRR